MKTSIIAFSGAALLSIAMIPAQAQQDSCNGSEDLGAVTLPRSLTHNPGATNFGPAVDNSNCGTWLNENYVVCLTPTNSCTVNVAVGNSGTNANSFLGPCTTTPASCLSNGTNFDEALIGGTEYCIVVAVSGGFNFGDLDITQTVGDCGALPVTIEKFTIE